MRVTDTAYYTQLLAEKYPDIPIRSLQQLCQLFIRKLYAEAYHGRDVLIQSSTQHFKMKVYRRQYHVEKANARARKDGFRLRAIRAKRAQKRIKKRENE